jgi:hypothetical protein
MIIDIPLIISVNADNEKEAEDLVADIMNDTMAIEVLCEGWRFISDEEVNTL